MNKNTFAFVVLLFLLFFNRQVFSQIAIDIDSIKTGKVYKLIMYDNQEFIGKVISKDSIFYELSAGNKTRKIYYKDISFAYKTTMPSVYKFILGVSGGLTLYSESENYYYHYVQHDKISGYNFGFEGVKPVSLHTGYRLAFQHSSLHRDDLLAQSGKYTYNDIHNYTITGDFLLGNFNKKNNFYYYFNMGAGCQITDESSFTHYTNWGETNFAEPPDKVFLMIDFGATAGIKISKNIGAYAHVQYNNLVNSGLFFIFDEKSYPFSAGISYFF